MNRWLLGLCAAVVGGGATAADAPPAAGAVGRGAEAVRGRPALNPPFCSTEAYEGLWKRWGVPARPADFARAVRGRYGLHPAPYENAGLPMGIHPARNVFGKGVSTDCLLCHAGTVAGKTVIGVGNAALDIETLLSDLVAAGGGSRDQVPFKFSHARGTIDPVSPFTYLMTMRTPDLTLRPPADADYFPGLCSDPPAWWQLKKKKTRDWTGAADARAARLDMVTLLSPFNSGGFVKRQEGVFADIHAFVMSVEAPKYPFPVDAGRAARGAELFAAHCASCHGTYGPDWTYPNRVVPLAKIGTDPALAAAFSKRNMDHFNASWFAAETGPDGKPFKIADTKGYQAPPLDGVWATAPYFHNGSVPTVYHVLNSKARPKVFTRSFRGEEEDYDPVNLGLKVTVLGTPSDPKPAPEPRDVYDTTVPGRTNGGHTYGDDFTEAERAAVIEYLKTL